MSLRVEILEEKAIDWRLAGSGERGESVSAWMCVPLEYVKVWHRTGQFGGYGPLITWG